jgi:hypothetical protein
MAARQDIPGAKAIYEELKKRFPGTKHKSEGDDDSNADDLSKPQG